MMVKLDLGVAKKYEKIIEKDLLDKFSNKILDQYNEFSEKASEEETKKAFKYCRDEIRSVQSFRDDFASWINSTKGKILS